MKLTFGKNKKLKSKKAFDELFHNRTSFFLQPIRTVYKIKPKEDYLIRIGLSVPKKKFRHSVTRNLIKRRIKEAYRLNQNLVEYCENYSVDIVLIYTSDAVLSYKTLEKCLKATLEKLNAEIKKHKTSEQKK